MIKATELRIGNYVYEEVLGTCSVSDICEHVVMCKVGNVELDGTIGTKTYTLNYSCITSIPLTEEWLLKFGFENVGYFKFWGARYFYKGICIYLIDNEFRFYYQTNRAFTIYDSVHETQNLFSALGEELTIK